MTCKLLCITALAALTLAGCYDVSYPDTYACSTASPEAARCPAGHVCGGKVCVPQGTWLDGQVDPDGAKKIMVSTHAGTGTAGTKGGALTAAQFNAPAGLCYTGSILYVADSGNHCIRKIESSQVSTFAGICGTGTLNSGYRDGPAQGTLLQVAKFNIPTGVATDSQGRVIVADWGNNCVRQIAAGQVSTLAGTCGSKLGGYQDGSATSAKFRIPNEVLVDAKEDILVTDSGNHCIRKITRATLTVSTYAGLCEQKGTDNGSLTAARFTGPTSLALATDGTLYVAEWGQRIRMITGGQVTTLAGSGQSGFADGAALSAAFNMPTGLATDSKGRVYVSDTTNNRIRLVAGDQVSTLAGSGLGGFKDGEASQAQLKGPKGIVFRSQTEALVADTQNHRIRAIGPL